MDNEVFIMDNFPPDLVAQVAVVTFSFIMLLFQSFLRPVGFRGTPIPGPSFPEQVWALSLFTLIL